MGGCISTTQDRIENEDVWKAININLIKEIGREINEDKSVGNIKSETHNAHQSDKFARITTGRIDITGLKEQNDWKDDEVSSNCSNDVGRIRPSVAPPKQNCRHCIDFKTGGRRVNLDSNGRSIRLTEGALAKLPQGERDVCF